MKKTIGFAVVAMLGLSLSSMAQDSSSTKDKVKHGAKQAWHETKKGAKAVGNKTAEVGSKGWSKVRDKKADQWNGPDGQTIYVTDDSRYYWVDKKGKRMYVTESEMKAKNK